MINLSYALNVQVSKSTGSTVADKATDNLSSLQQAINNVLAKGTVFKIDIELTSGQSRTIDLNSIGIPYIRCILLKSDNQFGYTLLTTVQNGANNGEPYWYLGRTAFIDFGLKPPLGIDPKYRPSQTLSVIKVESPAVTHPTPSTANTNPIIMVQLIAIGG